MKVLFVAVDFLTQRIKLGLLLLLLEERYMAGSMAFII